MGDLTTLLAMTALLLIVTTGFAHMVGGGKASGWILRLVFKIMKTIAAAPFIWAGKFLLWIGKGIK